MTRAGLRKKKENRPLEGVQRATIGRKCTNALRELLEDQRHLDATSLPAGGKETRLGQCQQDDETPKRQALPPSHAYAPAPGKKKDEPLHVRHLLRDNWRKEKKKGRDSLWQCGERARRKTSIHSISRLTRKKEQVPKATPYPSVANDGAQKRPV